MALQNLISIEVTPQEVADLTQAITVIENFVQSKLINLTPEQRKEYARISDARAPWVLKVNDYMKLYPDTVPKFIDTAENDKDFATFKQLRPLIHRLDNCHTAFDDTFLLLGNDLFQAALVYYKNLKLLVSNNVPASGAIYDDLRTEFNGQGVKKASIAVKTT